MAIDSEIEQLAIDMGKATTRDRIKTTGTWKPFTLLYSELIKENGFIPLRNLSEEIKRKYWNETNATDKIYKRKFIVCALYVYDLIMEK